MDLERENTMQNGGEATQVDSPPLPVTEHEEIEAGSSIEKTLHMLTDSMQELRAEFIRSGQVYERQRVLLDKLHAENEQLRRAELERARDPVVRDLISLVDTCLRNGRAWLKHETVTPGDVEHVLGQVTDEVKLILQRQGVETFSPEAGTKFDRTQARAVRSATTSDASLDGLVAETLKPGYRMGPRVIRYCDVVVWVFEAAADSPDDQRIDAPAPEPSGRPE